MSVKEFKEIEKKIDFKILNIFQLSKKINYQVKALLIAKVYQEISLNHHL